MDVVYFFRPTSQHFHHLARGETIQCTFLTFNIEFKLAWYELKANVFS